MIKASPPYFLVLAMLTCENSFKEQDVSYLSESEEKVNQGLKIDERSKLIDLYTDKKVIFNNNFVV